jgi:alpha-tubulin suppressor-like RCC1 family protein
MLYCWGRNANGEIGNGVASATPVSLPATILPSSVLKVALGTAHTCVIQMDNKIYCWGSNGYGELGSGNQTPTKAPGAAISGVNGAIDIVAGEYFTCARTAATVYCWGRNSVGEIGISGGSSQPWPQVVPGVSGATLLVAGNFHAGAVTAAGHYMWGYDLYGQLGDGMTAMAVWAPELVPGLQDFVQLSMSGTSTCGLTAAGRMFCWGYNGYGELGNGTTSDSSVPVPVKW